jgi:tRNA/tmRNA/rRNA uracil-C5-methylase (TrmA/RlmC/RlmD family)
LHDRPTVRLVGETVERAFRSGQVGERADVVVLDPPRAGAGLEVSAALAVLPARAIAYVSCDAATCARDLRVLRDGGWSIATLRAFDLYPQTEHVELVTVLTRSVREPSSI